METSVIRHIMIQGLDQFFKHHAFALNILHKIVEHLIISTILLLLSFSMWTFLSETPLSLYKNFRCI